MLLDTCIQLCRAAALSLENSKAISRPIVDEMHAVQGAAHDRQSTNTVECEICGKTDEKCKQNALHLVKSAKGVAGRTTLQQNVEHTQNREKKKPVHNVAKFESDEYEEILC